MFVCLITGCWLLHEYHPVEILNPQCRKSYLWIRYLNVSIVCWSLPLYRKPVFMSCGFLNPPSYSAAWIAYSRNVPSLLRSPSRSFALA